MPQPRIQLLLDLLDQADDVERRLFEVDLTGKSVGIEDIRETVSALRLLRNEACTWSLTDEPAVITRFRSRLAAIVKAQPLLGEIPLITGPPLNLYLGIGVH